MIKNRDSSLDIIRIVAFFSVVSVHFFLNNGFYTQAVNGKRMYVAVLIRTFFMICVPLFMILSGYLMNNKKNEIKYYIGITKTYSIYVIASFACGLLKKITVGYDLRKFIIELLDFSAAPYSWYIEMYLGLFLLIPFLNIIYNGLENKKKKQLLILILLFITSINGVFNIKHKIIPTFWNTLYPITYYFIGAYLSEFKPEVSNKKLGMVLLLNVIVGGSLCFYMSYGQKFIWGGLVLLGINI